MLSAQPGPFGSRPRFTHFQQLPKKLLGLLLQILDMKLRHGVRYLVDNRLHLAHQIRPRITLPMVYPLPTRLSPDIVDDETRKFPIEIQDAALQISRVGDRPEAGAREAKGHGAEDHGLAAVGAHPGVVAAPADALVDYDEGVGHFLEDV